MRPSKAFETAVTSMQITSSYVHMLPAILDQGVTTAVVRWMKDIKSKLTDREMLVSSFFLRRSQYPFGVYSRGTVRSLGGFIKVCTITKQFTIVAKEFIFPDTFCSKTFSFNMTVTLRLST